MRRAGTRRRITKEMWRKRDRGEREASWDRKRDRMDRRGAKHSTRAEGARGEGARGTGGSLAVTSRMWDVVASLRLVACKKYRGLSLLRFFLLAGLPLALSPIVTDRHRLSSSHPSIHFSSSYHYDTIEVAWWWFPFLAVLPSFINYRAIYLPFSVLRPRIALSR